MKRHRVLALDFNTMALTLEPIQEHWEPKVKELHRENQQRTEQYLVAEFGARGADAKCQNFVDVGFKPLSILAFHNRFLEQIRVSFVMGAYYPALTAATALGERILNHLVRILREDFKHSPEYKRIYNKDSIDDWDLAIDVLLAWHVLQPETASEFRRLQKMRHDAIHFRLEVDTNDRRLALDAIKCVQSIVANQFSGLGTKPWFLTDVPGETYIKKEFESNPFVRKLYLPNTIRVGPNHRVKAVVPQWIIQDHDNYEARDIDDAEFCKLRRIANERHVAEIEAGAPGPDPVS